MLRIDWPKKTNFLTEIQSVGINKEFLNEMGNFWTCLIHWFFQNDHFMAHIRFNGVLAHKYVQKWKWTSRTRSDAQLMLNILVIFSQNLTEIG